jgi:hypothetical protein
MAIGRRPSMSLTISNNLLAPNIMAINLRIPPRIISKTYEDGSFGIKHPERCSYTIPESLPGDK